MALAKACADLRAGGVRELNLNSKGIDADGARALAAALEQNGSLTTLHLYVRLQLRWRSERGTDASGVEQWHWRRRRSDPGGGTGAEWQPHVPEPSSTSAAAVEGRAGH